MRIFRTLDDIPVIERSVITIGSFDGVHKGHKKIISRIIELAKEIDGQSIIITFHPHPRSVIYPKDKTLTLLTTLEEKIKLLEDAGVDNLVIVPFSVEFSQLHPREYIEKFLLHYFKPSYIAIGYDHKFGLNREGNIDLIKQYESTHNFKVVKIEKQEVEEMTISSTKIRLAVQESEMKTAYDFLGRHYQLSGEVAYGEQIGNKLGFPTANISIKDSKKLIPPDGVYAVLVQLEEKSLEGMLYIGNRPTLEGKPERRIEVNIFDFNENIYGHNLTIDLVMYIRDDMKFDSLEKLKVQLHEDALNTRLVLQEYQKRYVPAIEKCSIVILNYNGEDFLESYMPSILYSSTDLIDIIVADNASTDGSVQYLQEWHPEIKVQEFIKNYGFAEGYNRALKKVDSKYSVILNNDVLVTEKWLDPIISLMESDPSIAACQPKICALQEPKKFEHAGAAGGHLDSLAYAYCKGRIFDVVETDEGQYDSTEEIFWASGAAMVIRTDLFNSIGGFDNTYFAHYEEIDLCWRMKRAGYKIMAVNSSVVYHLGGGTLPYESSKKVYLNFRNSLTTFLKNETGAFKYLKFLLRLILDGVAAIMLFMKGQWNAIPTILKAHWYVYRNFSKTMKSKRKYDMLIDENRIGSPNLAGRNSGIIPIKFYLFGKKNYKEL